MLFLCKTNLDPTRTILIIADVQVIEGNNCTCQHYFLIKLQQWFYDNYSSRPLDGYLKNSNLQNTSSFSQINSSWNFCFEIPGCYHLHGDIINKPPDKQIRDIQIYLRLLDTHFLWIMESPSAIRIPLIFVSLIRSEGFLRDSSCSDLASSLF